MTRRHRPAQDVLSSLKDLLVSKPAAAPAEVLDRTVDLLYEARGYFWIGIYLAAGDKVIRQCSRGPVPSCDSFELGKGNVGTTGQTGVTKVVPDVSKDPTYSMCFVDTRSESVVPIKIASRNLGVIDVESDRLDAFSRQERVLLEQAAELIARYLTTDKGKLLSRKAREQSGAEKSEPQPHKRPQSARPGAGRVGISRAAAGEHSIR